MNSKWNVVESFLVFKSQSHNNYIMWAWYETKQWGVPLSLLLMRYLVFTEADLFVAGIVSGDKSWHLFKQYVLLFFLSSISSSCFILGKIKVCITQPEKDRLVISNTFGLKLVTDVLNKLHRVRCLGYRCLAFWTLLVLYIRYEIVLT